MELTSYVEAIRQELAAAAATGGEDALALAERLAGPLESAVRLALLEALSAAAAEITRELAPGAVDLRLRGREPSFVVTAAPAEPAPGERGAGEPGSGEPAPPTAAVGPDGDEGAPARINFRLPEHLKSRIEEAAGRAGLSVNAWLVRAAAAALGSAAGAAGPAEPGGWAGRRGFRGPQHYTGWVR